MSSNTYKDNCYIATNIQNQLYTNSKKRKQYDKRSETKTEGPPTASYKEKNNNEISVMSENNDIQIETKNKKHKKP